MKLKIIVAISGGIAAYKSAYLVRLLKQQGADVRVVMTQNATQFIAPTTLQALSTYPVRTTLWDATAESAMSHIELARWADQIIIAPASANVIAKLSYGLADDLLSTLCLATTATLFIAPAMNQNMWHHAATQENLTRLQNYGYHIIAPQSGEQACGEIGMGRMAEPEHIVQALQMSETEQPVLVGKRVLVTAGPTHEAIDAVRYLANRSSGKMGFAMAQAAVRAGAEVTLISGPVSLTPAAQLKYIKVVSAQDMLNAVMSYIDEQDIFISSAAVADFKCLNSAQHKLAKDDIANTLELAQNPDILATVAHTKKVFSVGFCAQTHDVLAYAKKKLKAKQCDMIAANDVSQEGQGFESDFNQLTVLWETGQQTLARNSKIVLAEQFIELIAQHSQIHLGESNENSTT